MPDEQFSGRVFLGEIREMFTELIQSFLFGAVIVEFLLQCFEGFAQGVAMSELPVFLDYVTRGKREVFLQDVSSCDVGSDRFDDGLYFVYNIDFFATEGFYTSTIAVAGAIAIAVAGAGAVAVAGAVAGAGAGAVAIAVAGAGAVAVAGAGAVAVAIAVAGAGAEAGAVAVAGAIAIAVAGAIAIAVAGSVAGAGSGANIQELFYLAHIPTLSMDLTALSVQGMISMASSISISSTVTVNLHSEGLVVPSTASCDMLAAPSQYHKRRHFSSLTS